MKFFVCCFSLLFFIGQVQAADEAFEQELTSWCAHHGALLRPCLNGFFVVPDKSFCCKKIIEILARNIGVQERIQLLKKALGNETLQDIDQKRALFIALTKGVIDPYLYQLVKFLHDRGAQIDLCGSEGKTALHYACQREPFSIILVRALVVTGKASVNFFDQIGYTPLDYLQLRTDSSEHLTNAIALMRKHGAKTSEELICAQVHEEQVSTDEEDNEVLSQEEEIIETVEVVLDSVSSFSPQNCAPQDSVPEQESQEIVARELIIEASRPEAPVQLSANILAMFYPGQGCTFAEADRRATQR